MHYKFIEWNISGKPSSAMTREADEHSESNGH